VPGDGAAATTALPVILFGVTAVPVGVPTLNN